MQIRSHSHPYTVVELDSAAAALRATPDAAKTFYLIDRNVAGLYERAIANAAPANRVQLIEATEEAKSYEQLAPVFCKLIEAGCRRNSHLVVVGGGVLQDIGCFVASVLFRGLRWSLVPTTLLAQCDSCIGSKSSLNIGRFKNQLGTFSPPHEVRLAFDFLQTLPTTDILGGMGEAIKLHLIDGEPSVERLRNRIDSRGTRELPLHEVVWDSLRIKQRFIEEDEFDQGVRNLLNYGHTFAHAFESVTRYAIPHGIAVSMGIACATCFSERLGMAPAGSTDELLSWLGPYFSSHRGALRDAEASAIVGAMKQDKKNTGDKITFILTRGPGRMEKTGLDIQTASSLLKQCSRFL